MSVLQLQQCVVSRATALVDRCAAHRALICVAVLSHSHLIRLLCISPLSSEHRRPAGLPRLQIAHEISIDFERECVLFSLNCLFARFAYIQHGNFFFNM